MESTIIAIVAICILLIGLYVWMKSRWQPFVSQPEMSEELASQYDYLKQKNIRCRIRYTVMSSGAQSGFSASAPQDKERLVTLEVHKADLVKAQQLLEQFSFTESFKL